MDEKSWNVARLIPTSGINGADEQERRATSALLAVMSAVKESGRVMTAPLGAPAGTVETFIEVPFDLNGKRIFPDGLIRARRGSGRALGRSGCGVGHVMDVGSPEDTGDVPIPRSANEGVPREGFPVLLDPSV